MCKKEKKEEVSTKFNIRPLNPKWRAHLMKEWDINKNINYRFEDSIRKPIKSVWWKCLVGHEWKENMYIRSKGVGCPYCAGKKIISA